MSKLTTATQTNPTKAWRHYRQIGEIHFLVNWIADQIGRMDWVVEINGTAPEDQTALLDQVANRQTATAIATNLFVAGQVKYVAFPRDDWGENITSVYPGNDEIVWLPVSPEAPKFRQMVEQRKDDLLIADALWPDPMWPLIPTSPLMVMSEVLDEIELLEQLSHAQNQNRLTQRGILAVASEFDFIAADQGSSFQAALSDAIAAPLRDPADTGAEPILLRGPAEQIAGGAGFHWERLDSGYDARTDERLKFAIQRAVWGFPLPPEILMGMTSTNRATAFQIEHQTYAAYLAQPANLVGHVFSEALSLIMDATDVRVIPDPGPLFARPATVENIMWAWANRLVAAPAVRRVLNIDEDDAATAEDQALVDQVAGPSTLAPAPAFTTGGVEFASGEQVDLDQLASDLAAVDDAVTRETIVAAQAAITRSMERLGAKLRSAVRHSPDHDRIEDVPNWQVPFRIDPDEHGIDAHKFLVDDLGAFRDWWVERWQVAEDDTNDLIGEVADPPDPRPEAWYQDRADHVVSDLAGWVLDTQSAATEIPPPPRDVIDDRELVPGGS